MKKTSKKLLSLFLAIVMIITSCSVGLTAFAADQPSDSYWSNKSDAEAAFDSLNDLVDEYVPMLLNIDAIKKILEDNLNMKVDENTTISDVVVGASPLLLGLLGGSADKAGIRGDSSPLADLYYAYLDDNSGAMDFYSLYKFCQDNKDKGGAVGEYASETLPKLQELLNAYNQALIDSDNETASGLAIIEEYVAIVLADPSISGTYSDISEIPLNALEEFVTNGKALKDTPVGDAVGYTGYMEGLAKGAKTNIPAIDNMAKAIYYTSGMGVIQLFAELYLGMASLSGLPLSIEGVEITMNNYPEVISGMYTFDDFCDENGISAGELDAETLAMYRAMYENLMIPSVLYGILAPEEDASKGPLYYEMCIGTLLYSGFYSSINEIKENEITDIQINAFVEYAKANFNEGTTNGQTTVDINKFIAYINSGDCPFSEPAKEFFRTALGVTKFREQLVTFQRLATDGKVNDLKSFVLNFNGMAPALDGKAFIEAVNFIVPSVILNKKVSSTTTGFQTNDITSSFVTLNTYFENIAPKTADKQFKYADYAIPNELTVDVVNAKLNGILDEYLAPGAMIAGIIDINEILGSLVESEIELYKGDGTGALDNLWLNLYEKPIETVFKLLPILDILLDEILVPLLLNGDGDTRLLQLYDIMSSEDGLLHGLCQTAGPEKGVHVGIGALNFDLNKALPAILHWITGDETYAYETVGKYDSNGADAAYYANLKAYCDANVDEEGNRLTYDGGFNSIPKFINIYAADKAIYKFKLSSLTDTLAKSMDPALAQGLTEAITELATFAMEAIDDYLAEHKDDARYGVDYSADAVITQRGLNNIMVSIPQVLDIMGKKFIEKYNIDSDWTYVYDGKIVEIEKTFRDGTVTQLQNTTLQSFKDSGKQGADAVLGNFVNILIGNWINAILDIVNDTVADKNNIISKDLKIVNELLTALGGFGEKSIVTDVVNGFFGLTRKDDASFTLKKNDATGFNGFSNESGFFLLTNIQYDDNGTAKGIVPFILSLINKNSEPEQINLTDILGSSNKKASFAPLLSAKSAAGTDYSKLLTADNVKAADELITKLDKILSSLLKNTSINGFDLTSTDSVLSGALSFLSNYIGQAQTESLLNLVDAYLECIIGENAEGPINAKKVYTSKNLSNLVVETYSLVEAIADNLLINIDSNGLIADAICGIVSPDSVGIRMNDGYSNTAKILLDGHTSWTELKDKDLKFGFSAGDKTAFYDALGESVNGIATVVGFVLTGVSASDGKNFYSELVYPIFTQLAKATGAKGVMSAADFNAATDAQKLIKGIVTPFANILAKLYKQPATFLINLLQGLAGIVDDAQLSAILDGVVAPINSTVTDTVDGVADLVSNLSPTLSAFLKGAVDSALEDIFPIDLKALLNIGNKDIVVTLINGLLPEDIAKMIKLPSINWSKFATAKSAGEALLLAYGYVVDTVLGSELLTSLLDSVDANISAILKNLSAAQILNVLNEVLDVAKTPTEIYWTFSEYASKLTSTFTYPTGITSADANRAVEQLDSLVSNIFPLLETFGVEIGDSLESLVNDKLFTNEMLTKLAVALYGALDNAVSSNATVADLLNKIGLGFSTKDIAAILVDKSYGATYSSAAATLKKTASWKKVKSLNWGFKNGSKMAPQGFINGLTAIFRPFIDIVAVLTADNALNINFKDLEAAIVPLLNTLDVNTELGETGKLVIKKGILTITIKGDKASTIKVKLANIVRDALTALGEWNLRLGTNGYENAIVPLLEAFMIDDLKTYKEYVADIKKAKDNVLLDVLNPILGFVNDALKNPVGTITGALPNVAYFIDNNGITQAVGNLLAPLLSSKGVLGVLAKNGLNIDKLLTAILGTDLGSIIADLIGTDVKLNLEIMHLEKCNIQDIVLPLVSTLLKDKLGIKIPEFTFAQIAGLGTLTTYTSAARNDKGNFNAKHVVADKGKVLIAVLRVVGDVLTNNAAAIQKLLLGIEKIGKNKTIANIIKSVFAQLKNVSKDDIVRAVFYFFEGRATDSFFDYTNFKYNATNEFSWGELDQEFCETLPPMLDGLVSGLLEDKGGLLGLLTGMIYKDEIISKLATALYGAIEGVKVGDIGSLSTILAKVDIDFSTANVAKLLTDEAYGTQYAESAAKIKAAGSWKNVKPESLSWGVKDRDSFVSALCAVLRPIYGVLDVLLNDGLLNLFDVVEVPGSDGYTSTIVPLLEAFSCYNIKTQYQYRQDIFKEYDAILKDVLNPLLDKVEDLLNAPIEILASMLPNLSLFFANDGLLQIIDNLLTPVSALLNALKPIVNINDLLDVLGVDLGAIIAKAGLKVDLNLDIYDLKATLRPLIGADNVVGLLNSILGIIKIGGKPLGLVLPEIDWFKLAAHGDVITNGSSAVATHGSRIYVVADSATQEAETLIAVLRFVVNTVNYKDNYNTIVNLIGGLLGGADSSITDVVGTVLDMLKGDADKVILDLVELLKSFA